MSNRYDFKTVLSFDTLRRLRSLALRENAISHPTGSRVMAPYAGAPHVAVKAGKLLYLLAEAQAGRASSQAVPASQTSMLPDSRTSMLPDYLLTALRRHALRSKEPTVLVPSNLLLMVARECIDRRNTPKPKASIRPGART